MIRKFTTFQRFGATLLGFAALAKAYEVYDESYMFTRILRTVKCGIHILYAYKIQFDQGNYLDIHDSVAQDIYESTISIILSMYT